MGRFIDSLFKSKVNNKSRVHSSNDFDIVVKVCDFVTPSKSAKKIIDHDAMMSNVIRNPKWKEKLRDGKILGLFTHKGRQPREQMQEIPYEDNIAISPYLCNYAKDVWVDGDTLYAGIDVFDNMQYGKLLKDMLIRGMNVPVSMAVRATSDNRNFYVKDLLGIDFTFRPDLEAEVITVNFSNGLGIDGDEVEDLTCSCCDNVDGEVDFSTGYMDEIYHFSYVPKPNDIILGRRLISGSNYSTNFSDSLSDGDSNDSVEGSIYSTERYVLPSCVQKLNELDIPFIRGETIVDGKLPIRVKKGNYTGDKLSYLDSIGVSDYNERPTSNIVGEDNKLGQSDIENPKIDIYYSDLLDNFSNDSVYNFSLIQYLQELRLEPYQVLKNRVLEVIRFLNTNSREKVAQVNDTLKSYVDTYLLKWVQDVLNHPEDNFNLMLGLRLMNYNIDRNSLIQLQRLLNRTKQTILSTSVMPPNLQKDVNQAYQLVIQDLYKYINSKSTSGNVLK